MNSTIILGLVGFVALILLGPILTIWSMNTLFPVLAIPYTVDTWLATVLLFGALKSTVFFKRS